MLALLLLLHTTIVAHAADTKPVDDPEVVPSAGLATEGGPATLYVNPANLAYDPDPSWGLFFRYDPDGYALTSGTVTGHVSGIAGGVRWLQDPNRGADFTVDLGAGLKLPKRFAVGGALRWAILAQTDNYVAIDAGVSWRPLPWIGVSVVTRNLGNPGGDLFAQPQTGGGVALRPFGRVLLLGADYLHTFGGVERPDVFAFTARIRPTSGLFLRAGFDTRLQLGLGVEMYFGGVGFGVHAGTRDYDGAPTMIGWVGTDERDEDLAPSRRQVTALELESAPAYLPDDRLLQRDDPSWLETLEHFDRAADTAGVQGLMLTIGDVELSWARWTELRDAIRRLRVRGKDVTVLLVGSPGNGAIYAGSAASKLLVHPAADVRLTGLSAERVHLRGLLESVGVDVQVVRRSDYKTAAETLTTTELSPAERQQTEALLDDLWDELVAAIAEGRARTVADVEGWIDGGPWSAEEAVRLGIVDGRAYPDQVRRELAEALGGKLKVVDLGERAEPHSAWEPPEQIAIVYVEGTIVRGTSSSGGLLSGRKAGAATIVEQLHAAARDVKTRAVVLRVDSPGGSAFASDEIWRGVEEVQAAGKPVVVSMGGVAASGGYYVAAGADAIWAEPTTVTGSIGVLALKASVGPLLERVGASASRVSRGRTAGLDSPFFRWDPVQEARVQALVDATYATFEDRVAQGRHLTPDQVEIVAQGRVWSGAAAKERGLVDALGGLPEALADAVHRAGIPARRPVEYVGLRQRRTLIERLTPSLDLSPLQMSLARIDRALVRLRTEGLVAGPFTEPVATAWLLATEPDETGVIMVDPYLLQWTSR